MKTITARYIAYKYLYGINHIVINKPFKYDKRTTLGKEANTIVQSLKKTIDRDMILKIKSKRAAQKLIKETVSIFNQPLVKDYINNKHYIKAIHQDRIEFYSRNHWAKNDKDLKILQILSKKFTGLV